MKKNSNWEIEEIGRKIKLKNEILLYDFLTDYKFRNKGFYTLLLKIIQNKLIKKKLIIYTTSNNKKSINAILRSGFSLTKKITKIN